MAKDRNTFAKRQRETEKKRKADQKRERRAKKKTDDLPDDGGRFGLTSDERSVLRVFRTYLMTPGKMLCFAKQDLESFDNSLLELTNKGLLIAERNQGGYSLTDDGFAAMKEEA